MLKSVEIMLKNIPYYHISPIENKESILRHGLISEHKQIFVSDCEEQLLLIAANQIFISEYSVFKILPDTIEGKIRKDDVGEFGANRQFIVKQKLIRAEYIVHIRDEFWNQFDLKEESLRIKFEFFGDEIEPFIESIIKISEEWCEHYNNKYNMCLVYQNPYQVKFKNNSN